MGFYESSIGRQLAAFQREAERLTRFSQLEGGRLFRSRLIKEQMSRPPRQPGEPYQKSQPGDGIRRKSGQAIRSIRNAVQQDGQNIRWKASAGAGAAYYVEDHNARGLINFGGLFAEVARFVLDQLAARYSFLARNPGVRASVGSVEQESLGGEFSAAAQEIAQHIRGVRVARKIRRTVLKLKKVRLEFRSISGSMRAPRRAA